MKNALVHMLAVGGAGFAGAVLRYAIALALDTATLPAGTFLINISGSFALGWFMAGPATRLAADSTLRLAVTIGFIGAFTTFSTFMYQSDKFLMDGSWLRAAAYLSASVFVGLLAARGGALLAG